jgi:hypothetical protein
MRAFSVNNGETHMTEPARPLTIDEAISEFQTLVRDELGDAPLGDGGPPAETPEEAETRRFLTARYLIGAACPAPARCRHQQCRRDRTCRHLTRIEARWAARRSSHPRRSPGADALRYAIWAYVSARRGEGL